MLSLADVIMSLTGVLIVVVVMMLEDSEADCPEAYWDEPSKKCASFIVSILEHVRPEDLRVNRTCALVTARNDDNTEKTHRTQPAITVVRMCTESVTYYA